MTFYLDEEEVGKERSTTWVDAVFARAFCENEGVFKRVGERLTLGFSVLVYVPGSCMDAAARYIIKQRGGEKCWKEFGRHPGQSKAMADMWEETSGVIEILAKIFDAGERRDVVFKNLDRMFLDNNGGVTHDPAAQKALFSLIESTRNVCTLGLVDREFGKLPDAVEAAFNEKVWLREIPLKQFPMLIPTTLAHKLGAKISDRSASGSSVSDRLPPQVEWLLASRLRWADPIRAVMIMNSVLRSSESGSLSKVMKKISESARPMEFETADSALEGEPATWEEAFPVHIESFLKKNIIAPYTLWKDPTRITNTQHLESDLESLPPGVILYGPSGTGKTLLARYVAKSIGLPIRVVSGADLRLPIHGQSERAIVDMFRSARRASPCVLVLDDADDLLGDRQQISGALAGAERAIVHTFLQELAGFGGRPSGVLVILTTNHFSGLDAAIRGRVPLHIHVPYPLDLPAIKKVVQKIAAELRIKLSPDMLEKLANRFYEPVIQTASTSVLQTPELRAKALTNQFSPREIQQAMRMLRGTNAGKATGEMFEPQVSDVESMFSYYSQLSHSPEAEALINQGLRSTGNPERP